MRSIPDGAWYLFAVGCMVGIFIPSLILEHYWFGEERAKSQENLIGIYNEVALGEDDASVAKKIIANVTMERVHAPIDESDAIWYVMSPSFDFGSGGWILFLCFTDGRLDGVQFGIEDNYRIPPREAPFPKGRVCW